jgi:hypothetical protein
LILMSVAKFGYAMGTTLIRLTITV